MRFDVVHQGSDAVLIVSLERGEKVKAEAGAMLAKTTRLKVHGNVWGGWLRAFMRKVAGKESFFFQEVSAEDGPGDVLLAPGVPGDVKIIPLDQDYLVAAGALLAVIGAVQMELILQKVSAGLFSGAGVAIMRLTGVGSAVVNGFGAIMEIHVPAGEEYVVDNGHLVAWSGDIEYKIVKAGAGWVSSLTSGEGLGCKFVGPGRVFVQTRNPEAFGLWMRRFVPRSSSWFG